MLMPRKRSAAYYHLQAAHIREFLETVSDDRLRYELLDAAFRFDQMAEQQARLEFRSSFGILPKAALRDTGVRRAR